MVFGANLESASFPKFWRVFGNPEIKNFAKNPALSRKRFKSEVCDFR